MKCSLSCRKVGETCKYYRSHSNFDRKAYIIAAEDVEILPELVSYGTRKGRLLVLGSVLVKSSGR